MDLRRLEPADGQVLWEVAHETPDHVAAGPCGQPRQAALAQTRFILRLPAPDTEWDAAVFSPPPDYVLLSDVESQDAERLNLAPARAFLETLRREYQPRVFQNTPAIFGLEFGKPSYVPNDWLYIYPRITLYTRRQ